MLENISTGWTEGSQTGSSEYYQVTEESKIKIQNPKVKIKKLTLIAAVLLVIILARILGSSSCSPNKDYQERGNLDRSQSYLLNLML